VSHRLHTSLLDVPDMLFTVCFRVSVLSRRRRRRMLIPSASAVSRCRRSWRSPCRSRRDHPRIPMPSLPQLTCFAVHSGASGGLLLQKVHVLWYWCSAVDPSSSRGLRSLSPAATRYPIRRHLWSSRPTLSYYAGTPASALLLRRRPLSRKARESRHT